MIFFKSMILSLKRQSIYKTNCIFTIISSIIFLLINYSLWRSLFLFNYISEEKFFRTLRHVMIITILNQFITSDFEVFLGNKIITGDLTYNLVMPYNTFLLLLSEQLGVIFFKFIYFVFPFSIFFCFAFHPDFKILYIVLFFISLFFSFVIIITVESIIGLLTMFVSQIFGLSLIKNTLINIFAGITIPFSFYPPVVVTYFKKLPFYYAFNIPIEILEQGVFNPYSFFILILWSFGLSLICFFLWKFIIKLISINGG